jgi:ATP-dependent RNA helicase DeaD
MARNEVNLLLTLCAYQVLHGLRCLLERQTRQGRSLQRMREQQFESQLLGFCEDGRLGKAMAMLDDIAQRNDTDIAMLAGALACMLESAQPGALPLVQPTDLPVPPPRQDNRGGSPKGKPGGRGPKPGFKGGPGKGGKGRPDFKGGKPKGKSTGSGSGSRGR